VLAIEPLHAGDRDCTSLDASVVLQRAQDERHRCRRKLAPNVDQELALLFGEVATAAVVSSTTRLERVEAAVLVRVVPALERRHRKRSRVIAAGLTTALLRELAKRSDEIAARKLVQRAS
jgi:hypothetical protein